MSADPADLPPGARLAVYYAPEDHDPLWAAGAAWLGRNPATGATVAQPDVRTIRAVTARPAIYGFHATLKAPFAPRRAITLDHVIASVTASAARCAPFSLPRLQVGCIDGFVALLTTEPSAPLHALADTMVRTLDPLRAPPTDAELRRRRAAGLSDHQERMLQRWGYPHVFASWRFHMTLTDRLPPEQAEFFARAARRHFGPLCGVQRRVRDVCLFVQPRPDAAFCLFRRIAMG